MYLAGNNQPLRACSEYTQLHSEKNSLLGGHIAALHHTIL